MNIVGIQESFNDYPNHIALILFTKYCTWDCKKCHNKYNLLETDNLSKEYINNYMEDSKPLINHIVVSGGEPTLEKEIVPFVKELKSRGYDIKLDTNGTNPEVLKELLPYLSVVAMDIKEDFKIYDRYKRICQTITEREFENVQKSITILSNWYEESKEDRILIFRTTLFDKLIDTDTIKDRLNSYQYTDYIIQGDLTPVRG